MAFGFDDFAKLFDPVSDLLGTSGKQGVGLLQQEPEDLQRAAMLAALAASGYGMLTAAAPGAAGIAAAGPSAALVTPEIATLAPEIATLAPEIAAVTPEAAGVMEAAQMNPELLSSINGPGINTAYGGNNFLDIVGDQGPLEKIAAPYGREKGIFDYITGSSGSPKMMEPAMDTLGNTVIDIPVNPELETYLQDRSFLNSPPVNIGSQDVGINKTALENLQRTQFQDTLNTRMAEMPGANIQQFENPASTTQNIFRGNPAEAGFQPPQVTRGGYFNNGITGEYTDTLTPFERGMETAGRYFDKASDYVEKNPYKSAGLAYFGASKLGLLDQPKQEQIASDYKNPYSMAGFRRSSPTPSAYRYTPRYAEGGIAGYAKGGRSKAQSAMDFYDAMNPQQESAPPSHGSPGIYYDTDADTRYLDPMEAAMVRMSKLNSRANVQAPTMTPSRRMGELDFKPVAAAQGGIMGYAGGGDVPIEEDEFNRLTGRGGGGRTKAEPDAKFSPTSEGAAAVSKLGQQLSAISPLVSVLAPVGGAIASAYGEHMAKNVNPDYSNEGRASLAQDARVAAFDASRSGEGISGVTPGGGSSDAAPATGDAGYGREGQHAAKGGIMGYNLGGYAAGGNPRLLRGPGDGMSDHIPATINNRQPARLADGEYVITADVVSHLGNGSTEAGARQLDAMMKRIRKGRTGTPKQGKQINPRKYLPA